MILPARMLYGVFKLHDKILKTQGCQLSRIWRDSHAFDLLLTHSHN